MKYIISIIIGMILINIMVINAEVQTIGPFKQGSQVMLTQTCSNCTYVNISSIQFPNSSYALQSENSMIKSGTNYYYVFTNTSKVGKYIYCGHGNVDGIDTPFCVDFEITTSGETNNLSNIVYVAIWITAFIFLYFMFIYKKKTPIYRLFGGILIFLNGLLGVFIFDNPLTLLIMFSSLMFGFREFLRFMGEITEDLNGSL